MGARIIWRYAHLSIGVTGSLFLFLAGISGAALMFGPELDRVVRSELYATHAGAADRPLSAYIEAARSAVPNGEPASIRWPNAPGLPLTVMLRLKPDARPGSDAPNASMTGGSERRRAPGGSGETAAGSNGETEARHNRTDRAERGGEPPRQKEEARGPRAGRPRMMTVYLDPPTAQVIGTADPRGGVVGWIRSLHEDLLVPMYSGRQIVGWTGVGLFVLCLSGLYLWLPKNATILRGLAWRRGPRVATNLHHRIGFWIALPMTVMAFTGAYQAFPQQGKAMMALVAPVSENSRQGFAALLAKPKMSPQQALDAASQSAAAAKPVSLTYPPDATGIWRVQLAVSDADPTTWLIDDAAGTVSAQPPQLQGDAILRFMRRLHEGRDFGLVWTIVVFSAGIALPTLMVTGVIMWLLRRKGAAAIRSLRRETHPAAAPAE